MRIPLIENDERVIYTNLLQIQHRQVYFAIKYHNGNKYLEAPNRIFTICTEWRRSLG